MYITCVDLELYGGAMLNISFWHIRMYFKPFNISSEHKTAYRVFS